MRALNRSRASVLEALEQAPVPADVTEIAARSGLRVNATRHHLAALAAEGRAVTAVDHAGLRGRPRVLWQARPATAGPYEHLALALLHARHTGESLEQAGRAVAPTGGDLVAFLAAEGFDPRPDGDRILLARCPLAAAVAADGCAVCSVHRGLVAAVADGAGESAVLNVSAPGRCHVRSTPPTPVNHDSPDFQEDLMTDTLTVRSLGALVAEAPARARLFDQLGLDYCCHGDRSLAEASMSAGLDPDTVVAALVAITNPAATTTAHVVDDPIALIDDIVTTHHAFLRDELPALVALAAKVNEVHGTRHPELAGVHQHVISLKADLEPHMLKEERILFPAVRLLVDGQRQFGFGTVDNPIRMMRFEHEQAGDLLEKLRRVTGGYAVPADGCASYEALYRRLEHVEEDTHLHIHKENNVLFPLATALQGAGS